MKELKYFKKLALNWDVNELEKALQEVLDIVSFPTAGKYINHYTKTFADFSNPVKVVETHIEEELLNLDTVVNQIVLTKKPEVTSDYFRVKLRNQKNTSNSLSREHIGEVDDYLKEMEYTQFIPEFNHTYFREIFDELKSVVRIGRIRIIRSFPQQCLSWHVDNDDKIHIPIKTNSGVRMIVEDECMHMPAGTTTVVRTNDNYHSIMNGGTALRVHLVIPFLEK
jgi:hypothetical protein